MDKRSLKTLLRPGQVNFEGDRKEFGFYANKLSHDFL